MFENFRQSLSDLFDRAVPPDERRRLLAQMKETLVLARTGVADLRAGLERSRARLAAEERELETVRRRMRMATEVGDAETVRVAERFEKHHAERASVLADKVQVQERELALAEQEVEEMTRALRDANLGIGPAGSGAAPRVGEAGEGVPDARGAASDPAMPDDATREELDALGRARQRANREADAARRLEELKRRMGK